MSDKTIDVTAVRSADSVCVRVNGQEIHLGPHDKLSMMVQRNRPENWKIDLFTLRADKSLD